MLTVIFGLVAATAGAVGLWQMLLRLRAGGTTELRPLVARMRDVFGDVIALGEVDSSHFMTQDSRDLTTSTADLRDRLRDKQLTACVNAMLDAWNRVFANAPPKWIGMAWVGGGESTRISTDSPDRRAQIARQVDAAREGQIAVQRVLDRCNRLTHWVIG